MLTDERELNRICQRYRMRVIRIQPQKDFYLLETNRGPKELRVWPRVDVLRWSFMWREQLARQGFRDVERFIRTRDAKPYVVSGRKGYTLTDHVRSWVPLTPTVEQANLSGQLVASMHLAQSSQSAPAAVELLNREQAQVAAETERVRNLYDAFTSRSRLWRPEDKWVASQFRPLLERMERGTRLLSPEAFDVTSLAVSHRFMDRGNLGLNKERIYLRGFYSPSLSVQQRDTAHFLRDLLFCGDGAERDRIDAFLDGYEAVKPLAHSEYRLLLAFMVPPQELWQTLQEYVHSASAGQLEECDTAQIAESIRRQQFVDELLAHIAQRAEGAQRGHVV
ncbi:phosphotransferase [Brevibacillus sp. B_LB10_24]|uniref:phosphotransferase n=1 Tax=Brevibacillus sp. B_LB10_24 TaxID=3380645 RepID=UPI0038BB8900